MEEGFKSIIIRIALFVYLKRKGFAYNTIVETFTYTHQLVKHHIFPKHPETVSGICQGVRGVIFYSFNQGESLC